MKAHGRAIEAEHQARGWLAWHIGALSRVEKLPPLSDLTGIRPQIKKMTPAEMRAAFASMREAA